MDGAVRGSESWETGFKDTVIAYSGEITRVKARFDLPGLYVWHCHIVEHEDNEMMRPYVVGPMAKAQAGKEVAESTPNNSLDQNYPNPFNPESEIRFRLLEDSRVVLKVFNNLGQEAGTLVDANLPAGSHAVRRTATDVLGT